MRLLAAALALVLCVPAAMAADQPGEPPAMPAQDTPPPLPAPVAPVQYYVGENGQQVGPLTLEQVQQRIRDGKTKRDDLVWKTGLPNWAGAESFAELKPSFQNAGPPALPPEATFKQVMIGTWESSYDMQGYLNTIRIAYGADGRYAGTAIATPPGGQPMQAALVGSWTIQPTGSNTFTLTMTGTTGGTGNYPMRVVDATTLENLGSGAISRKIGM